jgi:RNA polymerase sigma-70 factor (ECF subfamily)
MLDYRDGAAAAFEALYSRHKAPLFRFVLRSVRERGQAEELHQDIWMRVIEARSRYQPQARFTTWLYTIAHNRLVDHWRRSGLRVVSLDDEAAPVEEPEGNPGLNPERQRRRQAERLAQADRRAAACAREAPRCVKRAPVGGSRTVHQRRGRKSRLRHAMTKPQALDG